MRLNDRAPAVVTRSRLVTVRRMRAYSLLGDAGSLHRASTWLIRRSPASGLLAANAGAAVATVTAGTLQAAVRRSVRRVGMGLILGPQARMTTPGGPAMSPPPRGVDATMASMSRQPRGAGE